MVTPPLPDVQHVSFCLLYNVILESHSVQNPPGGSISSLRSNGICHDKRTISQLSLIFNLRPSQRGTFSWVEPGNKPCSTQHSASGEARTT